MIDLNTCVTIAVPLKAEHVSLVRLASSGVASRIGFDMDTIEDIKVSISEVCTKVIERAGDKPDARLEMDFSNTADSLTIRFRLPGIDLGNLFDEENDGFALAIIQSLMDEVSLTGDHEQAVSMTKKLGRTIWDE